jgi:hypothetical protein
LTAARDGYSFAVIRTSHVRVTFAEFRRTSAVARLILGLVLLGQLASGCKAARDFLPRTHTTAPSPDGRYVAAVRQFFNIDPPDDHLYLGPRAGPARRVMDLGGDIDWCQTIVWSPDSRRVGFLIRDQRLAVFDSASAELVALLVLVDSGGAYPGANEARDVAFDATGDAVSFTRAARTDPPGPVTDPRTRETMRIPASRLRLRVMRDTGQPVGGTIWVRLSRRDRADVSVKVTPGPDGVFTLPAFDEGPFPIVEVFVSGSREHAVLREVTIGDAPTPVRIPGGR